MKLNLCCGPNMFPGWINIDRRDMEAEYLRHLREAPDGFVWPEPQRELAAWVKAGRPLEFVRHDVRRGLTLWGDNTVDAVYVGQAIEHFNRLTEAPAFLRECLRVLKPGGAIRLTTPDLNTLLVHWYQGGHKGPGLEAFAAEQPEFYRSALREDQLSYLLFGASGPDCTTENYEGHFHCYTPRSLRTLLNHCGFRTFEPDIVLPPATVGLFVGTRDMGMSHSFAIEGVKP